MMCHPIFIFQYIMPIKKPIYLETLSPGVIFTNLLAQSANAPVVIFWHHQSFFCAVQFHQQNYGQLCQHKQLENTLNFKAVHPVLYASKFGVNLLAQ